MNALRFAIQIGLGIVLPLFLQLWDRRRLTHEQRDRAWNAASWGSALCAFGPLSMLGWYWVTRRTWWALALGLLCVGGLGAILTAVDTLLEMASTFQ